MMSPQAITKPALTPASLVTPRAGAVALVAVVLAFGLVQPAAAQSVGVETLLQNVVNFFTGNTTRLLAILAVIIMGILAMFGIFDFRRMAIVVVGMVVVFGAAQIVSMVTGSGA
jgi:type IV secretory pathway VirB2 component (pilin)